MRLPPVLLALDILGTVVLGIGIYGYVSNEPVVLAGFLNLSALAVPLMIFGAFLIAPLVAYLVMKLASGSR